LNQNHPPRVRAMLSRIELIKTDLSKVNMNVSLDGSVKDLPETAEILSSINSEDKTRLLTALNDAFSKRDLTKVSALYSYIVLFSESDQLEIKVETLQDFQLYIRGHKDEDELNEIFTHPGFSTLITTLNNKELTDLQFRLFARYHLENKTRIGKKIAGIQKNLPLNEKQKAEVIQYLEEMKAEKQENDFVENKKSNKALIWTLVGVALIIIRILLRLSRD
jgi:hypothetical protein